MVDFIMADEARRNAESCRSVSDEDRLLAISW